MVNKLDAAPAAAPPTAGAASPNDTFATMVGRLSNLSAGRGFDAFRDLDWDAPELAVDPSDPRFALPAEVDPFAATEWYRCQPIDTQARLGALRMASCLKTGWQFETLLQQGLLGRAMFLPAGSPEFRYLHHEVIEESQHTLMFNEFVNRSGVRVSGMPRWLRRVVEQIVPTMARRLPALFFVLVLGGEDPVDHLQRLLLAHGGQHPLLEQIMRAHISEEARHISYARSAMKVEVPKLGWARRQGLAVAAPVVLGIMIRLMVAPTTVDMARHGGVPRSVVRRSFRTPAGRKLFADCAAKPRRLLRELGLLTPLGTLVWKAFGIWSNDRP